MEGGRQRAMRPPASSADGSSAKDPLESREGVEKRMLAQADTVGELLEQFRGRISPDLVGGPGWDRLLERARALPMSLATTGFGFEVPLHDPVARADLGVGLFEGSVSAASFEEWSRSRPEAPPEAALVRLLGEMGRKGSALGRIAGRKLLLEYDVDPAHQGASPEPGIFLYPAAAALTGGASGPQDGTDDLPPESSSGGGPGDLLVVARALYAVSGWDPDDASRDQAERIFAAMPPGTHIGSVGAFPARERALRVAVEGFRRTPDVATFLERIGWEGRFSAIAPFASRMEERCAFVHLAAHFDLFDGGLGVELGLSFYATDAPWPTKIDPWAELIDGLREEGLAVERKLSALAASCAGVEVMFGRKGMLVVARGIHHVKASLVGHRVERVKAYVFHLVFPPG